MFSHLTARQIVQALRLEDARTLMAVPGIGAKTASRMAIELKDRLDDLTCWNAEAGETVPKQVSSRSGATMSPGLADVSEALAALGYQERETIVVLTDLAEELATLSLSDGVRRALRALSR